MSASRLPMAFLIAAAALAVPGITFAQSVYEALGLSPGQPPTRYGAPQPLPFIELPAPQRLPPEPRREIIIQETPKPVMPVKAKPARVPSNREIVASLMRDSTLRPGDVVVFPNGPRVFNGTEGSSSHRMRDFEDLRTSRLVSGNTRRAVLASTQPGAALAVAQNGKPRRGRAPAAPPDITQTGSVARPTAR